MTGLANPAPLCLLLQLCGIEGVDVLLWRLRGTLQHGRDRTQAGLMTLWICGCYGEGEQGLLKSCPEETLSPMQKIGSSK